MPFDWGRCTLASVLRALRTDFQGFLEYERVIAHGERPEESVERDYENDLEEEANVPFKDVYVCDGHSFWHDDLWDEREWRKYERRIQRFQRLQDTRPPLLFVRAASHTDELASATVLHELLQEKFGSEVQLLLLLSYQPSHCAVFFDDRPGLIVTTLGTDYDRSKQWVGMLPYYMDSIWDAIWHRQSGALPRSHVVLSSFDLCFANKGVLFQDVDYGEDHTTHWTPFPNTILKKERSQVSAKIAAGLQSLGS